MAIAEPTAIEAVPNSAELCDQHLAAAGLHHLWEFDALVPPYILELASEAARLQNHVQLSDSQTERMQILGSKISDFAKYQFPYANPRGKFRAYSAIGSTKGGNCMAYHEIVSGTLAGLGLSRLGYGSWTEKGKDPSSSRHAESGFIVGDRIIEIDGYFGKSNVRSKDADPLVYQAVTEVTHGQKATLTVVDTALDCVVGKDEPFPIEKLHQVDLRTPPDDDSAYRLYLPAAAAVLMYCAIATSKNTHPDHATAREVLQPFAPKIS